MQGAAIHDDGGAFFIAVSVCRENGCKAPGSESALLGGRPCIPICLYW